MTRRGLSLVVALCGAALLLGIFARISADPDKETSQPDADVLPVLLAADHWGAVVATQRELRGYSRARGVVWRRALTRPFAETICAPRCPAALLSGVLAGELAPDPAPVTIAGANVPLEGWLRVTSGKNRVLSALAGGLRWVSNEAGSTWQAQGRGAEVAAFPVAAADVLWMPSSGNLTGVAMSWRSGSPHPDLRAFSGLSGVWRPVSPPVQNRRGGFGCISGDGKAMTLNGTAMLIGQQRVPLSVNGEFGNCAFSTRHLILSANSSTPTGPETVVVAADLQGKESWRTTLRSEAFVSASPLHDVFVIASDGPAGAEIRRGDGALVRAIPDAVNARFDERGALVTLDRQLRVRWRDAR